MSIHVQGKGCRVVAKILLDRFYIIAAPKSRNSIRMSKIMKASIRTVDFCDQLFEVEVHGLSREISTELIRKYKSARIAPCLACSLLPLILPLLLALEDFHNIRSRSQIPRLPAFGGKKVIFTAALAFPLELLIDCKYSAPEVHTIPSQAQHLPFPESGKESDDVDALKLMALANANKVLDCLIVKGLDFFPDCIRQLAGVIRVYPNIPELLRLLKCAMKHAVDVADRFRS